MGQESAEPFIRRDDPVGDCLFIRGVVDVYHHRRDRAGEQLVAGRGKGGPFAGPVGIVIIAHDVEVNVLTLVELSSLEGLSIKWASPLPP